VICHEKIAQQKNLSLAVQIPGGNRREHEVLVERPAVEIILELVEKGWDIVERHPQAGKLVDERRHRVVILDGVQPDPGQHRASFELVAVVRLVHVPENGNLEWRAHPTLPC
jgi:hypothetical protein